MKVKLLCLFIGALFLCTALPTVLADDCEIEVERNDESLLRGYFIFGFMRRIDPEESNSEFEIVYFIILVGNGERIRLDKGEMIKIYGPILGLIYNNLFVGYIGDYSIIG